MSYSVSCNQEMFKVARVQGLERNNGPKIAVPFKKTGEQCKCRKDCFHKFSEEEKMYIIRKLNEMSSKLEQDTYLQNLIQCCDVKRRRPRKPKHEAKERVSNYLYFVNGMDRKVQVCRNAFISLHGLTNKKTRRLCLLLREGLTPTEARERVRCFRRSSCMDTQLNNWNCVPGYVYADPLWS